MQLKYKSLTILFKIISGRKSLSHYPQVFYYLFDIMWNYPVELDRLPNKITFHIISVLGLASNQKRNRLYSENPAPFPPNLYLEKETF